MAAPALRARVVTTDDLGEFRVGSLPAGRYDVILTPRESAARFYVRDPAGPPAPATVDLQEGTEAALSLTYDGEGETQTGAGSDAGAVQVRLPTPILRGRVIDATGRPAQGAWIQLESLHGIGGRTATADSAGRYEIYGVQTGDYRLTVRHMGVPVRYGQRRPGETGTIITLRPNDVLEGLDVRLPSAGTIAGRVVDAYGDALEGITLSSRSVPRRRAMDVPVHRPQRLVQVRTAARAGGVMIVAGR